MKTKRLIAQLLLLMMFVVYAHGQKTTTRASTYEGVIVSAASRHKVDPYLLWTIAYLESRFRPDAISYKDGKPCAYGLMQFVPATARRYGLKNPHNAAEAIDAAARYVHDLQERFGGRAELILAAYNAGEGTVEAFRDGKRLVLPTGKIINPNAIRTDGVPPYTETREYVIRGRIVYQNVARSGVFSAVTLKSSQASPHEVTAIEDSSKNKSTESSIYPLATAQEREKGTEQGIKSPKSKQILQTHSIYAN